MTTEQWTIIGTVATILGLIVALFFPIRDKVLAKKKAKLIKAVEEDFKKTKFIYDIITTSSEGNDSKETKTFEVQPQFINGKLAFGIINLTDEDISLIDITISIISYSSNSTCYCNNSGEKHARLHRIKLKKSKKMKVKFDEKVDKNNRLKFKIAWKDSNGFRVAWSEVTSNEVIKI